MFGYDKSLPRAVRRALGAFYTPTWVVEEIVRRTVRPGDSVLDLACGDGAFLRAALAVTTQVTGIDIDGGALRAARHNAAGARLVCADALSAPLEPADVVIGNPPYLKVDDAADFDTTALRRLFPHVYRDKTDLAYYFMARAVELARREVGLIVPRAFLESYKADRLRAFLAGRARVREIVDFGERRVFEAAAVATCLVFLECGTADTRYGAAPWIVVKDAVRDLNAKIDAAGDPVGDVLVVGQGMQTGCNRAFAVSCDTNELVRKRARNTDIHRFDIRDRGECILYFEDVDRFEELPSHIRAHLLAHESELRNRAGCRRGDCAWWKYTWPLHKELYDGRPRLLCPYLAGRNRFALAGEFMGLTDTTVLFDNGQPEDIRYFEALLNSAVLTWRYRTIGKVKSKGIREFFWNGISRLPVPRIDPADRRHADLVATRSDDLVYELYGLTGADIDELRRS